MEQKKMAEAQKGIRKYERRIKELSYQVWQHRAQLQPSRTWPNSPCAQILVLADTPLQPSPALASSGRCAGTDKGRTSFSVSQHPPPALCLCLAPLLAPPKLGAGRPGGTRGHGAGGWVRGAGWCSLCEGPWHHWDSWIKVLEQPEPEWGGLLGSC